MVKVPADWTERTLADLFDISAGGDLKKAFFSKNRTQSHTYKIFSNAIENYGFYGYTAKAYYPADSITVTARGTIGKAYYRDEPFDAIIRLLILKPKRHDICARFYAYYINHMVTFDLESTGVPQLTVPKIGEKKVPFFRKLEQQAIADILSTFDTYISDITELIEKKRAIRDGALEDLVSGKTRLNGEAILWEKTTLAEESFYAKGNGSARKYDYISTENMNANFMGVERYKEKKLVSGTKFEASDVLMANIRPYLKKIWFANFSGKCSADVLVIRASKNMNAKFLYYSLANDRFIAYVMDGGVKGIKMPRGDKKYIMKYEFLKPQKLEQQQTIADTLTAMDDEIRELEEERSKMKEIREGAMDDLLTGRVRLPL